MRQQARELRKTADEATLIRCRYCAIKDDCSRRDSKETMEAKGILTFCAITPNKGKKKRKKA